MGTREHILKSAEALTRIKGFDAFSYRDIAAEVGVKSSSIHYYFPTKSDLAVALIEGYTAALGELLAAVSAMNISGYAKMRTVFRALTESSGGEKKMCLCGMIAANIHSVDTRAKARLSAFFSAYEIWLESALRQGIEDGSVLSSIDPEAMAIEIAAVTEGAMLIARVSDRARYLPDTLELVLKGLKP